MVAGRAELNSPIQVPPLTSTMLPLPFALLGCASSRGGTVYLLAGAADAFELEGARGRCGAAPHAPPMGAAKAGATCSRCDTIVGDQIMTRAQGKLEDSRVLQGTGVRDPVAGFR